MAPRGWWSVLRATADGFSSARGLSVAGGVGFFALLALFPALTTLVAVYGLFSDPLTITGHLNMLARFLPGDVVEIIRTQLERLTSTPQSTLSVAGIAAALVALYSATGGIKALIESLNLAWGRSETRGVIRLNLIALTLTLGAIALVIAIMTATVILPPAMQLLHVPPPMQQLVSLARWPAMFAVLTLAIALLYRWAPAAPPARGFRVMPGALFAAILLVAASVGFSWYVANLASYSETYGSLGAVVVLLMWLWIGAIVVILGATFNAQLQRYLDHRASIPVTSA